METNETQQKEINQTMEIDGSIMSILNETRKWTKFLSIIGFIGVGILLLMSLFIGSILSTTMESMPQSMPFSPSFIGVIYVVIAIVYFFPVLFLFNFSNKLKTALYTRNQEELYNAFNNLKRHFKFIGILIIVGLLIWGTMIIAIGIVAAI